MSVKSRALVATIEEGAPPALVASLVEKAEVELSSDGADLAYSQAVAFVAGWSLAPLADRFNATDGDIADALLPTIDIIHAKHNEAAIAAANRRESAEGSPHVRTR